MMVVKTTWNLPQSPNGVWPLLCNSQMQGQPSCYFTLGLPQPQECRLAGDGAVGDTRQCRSDRGTIQQRILVWDAPRRLSFRMERTDIYFRRCVPEIVETFELQPASPGHTRITRTTHVEVNGWFRCLKLAMLYVGLKKIHRYVFHNWQRILAG